MSGRRAQVSRVSRLLSSHCNVALHAAPGTGKTWLADQVIESLDKDGDEVRRFDLSLYSSSLEFFCAVADQLNGAPPPEDIDIHGAWRHVRSELLAHNGHVILVLDEFDAVVKFMDAAEFLPLFRELVHRPNTTHCSTFIVSRRPLATIESIVRGISTLATLCYPEYLGAVQEDDLAALWPGAVKVSDRELEQCLAWSAGYPPLVQYWLAVWPDPLDPRAGGHQQVVQFGRLVDYLEAMNLRDAAAQLVLGPVIQDWIREVSELEVLGILGEGSNAFAANEVFRDYLRSRSLGLSSWGLLGRAEIAMRSVIAEVFHDRLGDDWSSAIAMTSKPVRVSIEEAESKQLADRRKFGRSGDWLAYTYPQDLGNIIMGNWTDFSAVFQPGDKRYWAERFAKLAEYRTPVAHNRAEVLSDVQRTQCQAYAEEVLNCIDRYAPSPSDSELPSE